MNAKSPNLFQNGLIDVFKMSKVFDLNIVQVNTSGEVSSVLDTELGKKTIKVTGNLSASNYFEIPNRNYTKSLNYTGRYYYIFFKAAPEKKFTFQLNFVSNNNLIRFSFKYPLKEVKLSRTNAYNIDIPVVVDAPAWNLIRFDPIEFIRANLLSLKEFTSLSTATSENTVLRSIQAWSSVQLRGVYISNSLFDLSNLPKDMGVRVIDQSHPYSNLNFIDFVHSIAAAGKNVSCEEDDESFKQTNKSKANVMENFENSLNEIDRKAQLLKNEKMQAGSNFLSTMKKIEKSQSTKIIVPVKIQAGDISKVDNEAPKKNTEQINKEFRDTKREIIKNIFRKDERKRKPLLPDPMLNLDFILGYTAGSCPNVIFQKSTSDFDDNLLEKSQEGRNIMFTSGNTLINYNPDEIKQNFYFGHSNQITNFTLAYNNTILISAQEGPNAIIRIWNVEHSRCIKMLTTPYDRISSLTVSRDSKSLCTVGTESYNKELIIIWDITNLEEIGVKIRQSSQFPIRCIKYSPFDQTSLVSCGKENIKFWRIKQEHQSLGGKPVVLNQFARNAEFMSMDFTNPFMGEEFSSNKGKVFVGNNMGCVIQISCNTQEMEAVYKIHDSPVLSIRVNDAFCVTGSADGFLRVWPVDFSEFLIEAKHDSGVCSVDVSFDSLEIICGTINGSIGKLTLENKEYKTILRSPPNSILTMTAHPNENLLFTIEEDKSVRVWDIQTKTESFQFVSNKDPPTTVVAPSNSSGNIFVCGFSSGAIKVFDLDKTAVLYECKPFNSPISNLKFIQNSSILVVMNSQGNMSIHDSLNNFIQIKILKIDEPANHTDLSISNNEDYFATIGPESNCVLVWNAKTFGIKNRIPVSNFFVTKVCLISKHLLAVILENCNVQFYSLATQEGVLVKEFNCIHVDSINNFLITKNNKYLISGGEEGMIKIWDSKMIYKPYLSYQKYIGHSNGIRSVILLEQKSLLITASDRSGILFWNFLGDASFNDAEITEEFEKFGNLKEMKQQLTGKMNSTVSSVNRSSFNKN